MSILPEVELRVEPGEGKGWLPTLFFLLARRLRLHRCRLDARLGGISGLGAVFNLRWVKLNGREGEDVCDVDAVLPPMPPAGSSGKGEEEGIGGRGTNGWAGDDAAYAATDEESPTEGMGKDAPGAWTGCVVSAMATGGKSGDKRGEPEESEPLGEDELVSGKGYSKRVELVANGVPTMWDEGEWSEISRWAMGLGVVGPIPRSEEKLGR